MWLYYQHNGALFLDGEFVATGYSGIGVGLNNPDLQQAVAIGPIPRGAWDIGGWIAHHERLGINVAPLIAREGTLTFGREGFFMHGDSRARDFTASHGCIVLGPVVRALVQKSKINRLIVAS